MWQPLASQLAELGLPAERAGGPGDRPRPLPMARDGPPGSQFRPALNGRVFDRLTALGRAVARRFNQGQVSEAR